jgi:DNA primase
MFDSAAHYTTDTEEEQGDTLILVEDVLSAIKVGRHYHTVAVLGSHINDAVIAQAITKKRVMLWLDDDKYKESQAFSSRLRGLGILAVSLTSNKDPKCLADSEIRLMVEC